VDSVTLLDLVIRGYAPQEIKVFRNRVPTGVRLTFEILMFKGRMHQSWLKGH